MNVDLKSFHITLQVNLKEYWKIQQGSFKADKNDLTLNQ